MSTVKKVVGKIPVGRGAYSASNRYYKENTVTLYGMSFRALSDMEVGFAPATINSAGSVILTNTDKWQLLSGIPEAYQQTSDIQNLNKKIAEQQLEAENSRKEIDAAIADEKTRAEAAEEQLRKDLDAETDANISAFAEVANRIDDEKTRAEAAEERIASDVSALTKKVNEIRPVEYTNSTIVNAADEEDITSGDDNLLRLKDRLPNGRTAGYKILRLDKSFTEQVCDDDTVYEIRYDFDLDGVQDFQIPANCVLKFEGGSLRNGTLTGNNTLIDARVERIFNTDVTIKGAWKISEAYPEWFGADPALEDNSAYINKAIEQLNNLPNPTILILTSAYKIKSTVWLRKNVSIVGIKEYDSYTTVTPKNKNAGSGFIVNFTDPCAYALDTYLLKDGEQYIYPYNQMWIDIESDGVSEPQNRDSGYVIKNININIDSSLLDDPEKGIFFGGIRLIDTYYGTLENIRIKGTAVGISLYNSWNMDIRNIFIICAVCGFYFGKYNTIQTVYNSLVEDSFWGRRLEWTEREGEELIWKNTDLFPPYDEKGEIPLLEDGSENTKFTAPIKVQSSAVISESYETDRNKLYFIGCTFQLLDAVSISSTCNLSFDFCYNEKIRKVLIWARGGTIRWKNPSFNGNKVRPYTFGTQNGNITIEGMTDFNCYPYCKKSNDGFYGYISDNFVYHYDKYQGVEGPSETGESGSFPNVSIDLTEAVSAPKRMPAQNVFYLGLVNYVLYYDYRIIGVASGLTKGRFTTFDTIMKAYRPKNATFITQSCSTDVGKNHEMWEDCNYTFKADKSETGKVSVSFVTSKALSLKNSKLHIPDFALTNQPRGYFDEPGAKTVNLTDGILFKCYGKNEIVAPQYIESKNFIELCGTEKIELNVVFKGVYFAAKNLFYNLDTCETKYKVTATVDSGTFVFTNPTPPKYGNEIGDVFMLSKDGVTTPVYWDGAKWVDSAGAEV